MTVHITSVNPQIMKSFSTKTNANIPGHLANPISVIVNAQNQKQDYTLLAGLSGEKKFQITVNVI